MVSYRTAVFLPQPVGLLIGVAVTIVVAYLVGMFALTRKAPTVFFISIITLDAQYGGGELLREVLRLHWG